jgi:GTP-binding protein
MFLDEKVLLIQAGKGGDGAALFRREIYVPRGGPDGGDGGNGGDIYLVGRNNLHAFAHLAHVEKIKAEDGMTGGHQTSTGKSGKHEEIFVPLGTVIEVQEEDNSWKPLLEINEENQRFLLAKGGSGGWGNWHFKSSIQQAPDRFNPGLPGDKKTVRFVLKLIADIGLVGLPNAGKSTLLSVISAARPKIANYPFTTLEPQLGVASIGKGNDARQVIVADLPGLIEGASDGKGLGTTFLKHIERTHTIIHCISAELEGEALCEAYNTIRTELANWSTELEKKPEMIALTKIDILTEEGLLEKTKLLKKCTKLNVYPISAASGKGIKELLTAS